MLVQALRCGVPYDMFWTLCPREVFYFVEAFNDQLEYEHFISVQNAWLTGKLFHVNPKKFPSLQKLLGKSYSKKRVRIQSMDEMLKMVNFMNKQMGGKDLRHGNNR